MRSHLLAVGVVACVVASASAADPRPLYAPAPSAAQRSPTQTTTKQPTVMDFVADAHKETVAAVMKASMVSAKSAEEEFVASKTCC